MVTEFVRDHPFICFILPRNIFIMQSPSDTNSETPSPTRNAAFNLLDGGLYGFGVGVTSFVTVLPLFVSQLTDSAILIGLIPALRGMGWQLPQLLTANRVARLSRYQPMMLRMIAHERLPYVGLVLIAWFLPSMSHGLALTLTYAMLIWNALGGGLAATPWQSLIAKIIPGNRLGFFFGTQAAVANLCLSLGALVSGFLLERLASPSNYTVCFLITLVFMLVSWLAVAQVREPPHTPTQKPVAQRDFGRQLIAILKHDTNFGWFLVARVLSQMATMAFSFYIVYATKHFSMSAGVAGQMTAVFAATQIVANVVMGWLGDRLGHRSVMAMGALTATASALLAWLANELAWFYLVFMLAGIATVAIWTLALALSLDFGTLEERPAYIGLSNTLIAPATILAPLIGGWLADVWGYPFTFIASSLGGVATAVVMMTLLKDPKRLSHA
jgi:MFS family permease